MSNVSGTLFLPSLDSQGNGLTIEEITRNEAVKFINFFTSRVESERKLKTCNGAVDDTYFIVNIHNSIFDNTFNNDEIIDVLNESSVRGFRGYRAVFVPNTSEDITAEIIVGTAVVYNKNWATLGIVDTSVVDTLEQFIGVDQEESADDENGWEFTWEDEYEDEDEYCDCIFCRDE